MQWVKNLTTAAQVTAEVWVQSLASCSALKDSALLQLKHRSQLWLRFNPWPRNFYMLQVQPPPKKRGIKIRFCNLWATSVGRLSPAIFTRIFTIQ